MKISNETRVGILAAFAIVAFLVGYNFLKGKDIFSKENTYYARYDQVAGLGVSKPVLINGFQIGRVSGLTLLPNGQILAEFKIKPEYEIPKNTIALLASTDLLGGKAIVFELGSANQFAANNDTLTGNVQRNIMDQVEPVQKKAEAIIAQLDTVLTSISAIMNPNFQKNVNRSFNSIANTLETLEGTSVKVDGLVGSQSTRIASILANVESISGNLKNNNQQITAILANFNKVSNDVASANFKETLQNANTAVANLQATVDKINNGKGSIGLLINDDKLYQNLNNAAGNLDKLMLDLRANPKRYVSFSVFGGKKD